MHQEPEEDVEDAEAAVTADGKVAKGGVTYGPGDCIFVHPHTFDALEDDAADAPEVPAYAAKGRFHKGGANVGLRAFGIARVVGLAAPAGKKARPLVRPLAPGSLAPSVTLPGRASCSMLQRKVYNKAPGSVSLCHRGRPRPWYGPWPFASRCKDGGHSLQRWYEANASL